MTNVTIADIFAQKYGDNAMTARAAIFLDEWMRDYVTPGPYTRTACAEAALKCDRLIEDAYHAGISSAELEAEVGNLKQFLLKIIDEKTAAEVRRLGETGGIDV
ncbi:hypothetical protein GCM10010909_06970 [Acidocella aquatica]|uniref:Uncharacterized protein n=1 Tax=Acidocella aquatica TaxID=1922313 RepID=A0ABQ6A1J2_9PROT|nr:hypothetical protein [Acidocella aquatica]GLR66019.1 hypothetical protein GCM10010909_06970 [Acidocella aquatica]